MRLGVVFLCSVCWYPCPPLYILESRLLVSYKVGVLVGLQGRVLVGLKRNRSRSPTSSFLAGSFLVGTSGSIPDKDPFLVPRTCCELCTSTLLVPMIFKDAHIHRPHRGKSQLIAMLYQIQPKPSMYQQRIIENMGARQHERLSGMIRSTSLLLCDTTTSPSPSPSPFVILDHTNLHVKARG